MHTYRLYVCIPILNYTRVYNYTSYAYAVCTLTYFMYLYNRLVPARGRHQYGSDRPILDLQHTVHGKYLMYIYHILLTLLFI